MLKYLDKVREFVFPLSKQEGYRALRRGLPELDLYFPFSLEKTADQLERQGFVEKEYTSEGMIVRIKDKGKTQILKYSLIDMRPSKNKWDGKWRLVFFDVAEFDRKKRDQFRKYLKQLEMEQFQKSVFISPYDIFDQVKYLREVLNIPNTIKMARLDWVENEEELKEIFELE
ncbi:MAG: hypothetical protein AAB550_00350 [Patescibacteria group bacterium]|mgnify:CR=1 FL=1